MKLQHKIFATCSGFSVCIHICPRVSVSTIISTSGCVSATCQCRCGVSASCQCGCGVLASCQCRCGVSASCQCRFGVLASCQCRCGVPASCQCRYETAAGATQKLGGLARPFGDDDNGKIPVMNDMFIMYVSCSVTMEI